MIVVSDTTPIIALIKAGKLNILEKLFGKIIIPKAIYHELTDNPVFQDETQQIESANFITVEQVSNTKSASLAHALTGLDAGESEAIILYDEKSADLLIIDERKGRRVAKQLNIGIVGSVGILLLAYEHKILSAEEVKKSMDIMLENNIRLSKKVYASVCDYVGADVR